MSDGIVRRVSVVAAFRWFPAAIAILAVAYYVLLAILYAVVTDGGRLVNFVVYSYAGLGVACSMLGLIGIVGTQPALIESFSYWLFADTVVSTIGRLSLLPLFETSRDLATCPSSTPSRWRMGEEFRHDVVTSARWHRQHSWSSKHGVACVGSFNATDLSLLAVLICAAAYQTSLGFSVHRFAKKVKWLSSDPLVQDQTADLEKLPMLPLE